LKCSEIRWWKKALLKSKWSHTYLRGNGYREGTYSYNTAELRDWGRAGATLNAMGKVRPRNQNQWARMRKFWGLKSVIYFE
jgi:hypothetical protein